MQLFPQPLNIQFDEDTQEVVITYMNGSEPDDPDPINFKSSKKVTVRLSNAILEDI